MKNVALLVIDMQSCLVNGHPYNEKGTVENIKRILSSARENNKEVIFVRHNDDNDPDLKLGSDGWQIYDELSPQDNEYIVEKTFNSAFHRTDLKEYLDSKSIDTLIITGMQTEYCIDATIKSAFDHEYKIIIPDGTNTTYDNECMNGEKTVQYYNYKIWNNRFGYVTPINDIIKMFEDK